MAANDCTYALPPIAMPRARPNRAARRNSLSRLLSLLAVNRAEFHALLDSIERNARLDLDTETIANEIDADFPGRRKLDAFEAQVLLARSAVRGLRLIEGRQ